MVTEMCKYNLDNGLIINAPCQYILTEIHKNVTVEVLKCPKCGDVSIGWYKQDNTEDILREELEE